jgi:hypothetical protein
MAWYAYCIGEKQAFPELARHRKPIPIDSLIGVKGNQVFLYPASDLAVMVSEHNPEETFDITSGVDHARVINECCLHSTVLPFRFGTVFGDDESLRKSVRSNQRQFLADIDKLHGKIEMHVKVLADDCCIRELEQRLPVGKVGWEYLTNLRETASRQRERQTRARALSFQLRRQFAPIDESVSCRVTESGKIVLDISHLIERKNVERYQNKFSAACAMMGKCKMQLSGPWPPYHFVNQLTRGAHTSPMAVPAAAVAPAVMPVANILNAFSASA